MIDLREIDAKIAETVFGWKRKSDEHGEYFDIGDRFEQAPRYSSNPADSKKVREKLAETYDWLLGKGSKMKTSEKPFGFALFKRGALDLEENPEPLFIAIADTEELAVALCALKALEAKHEGTSF